ncbi:MAG: acetyl-CoA carboxylase biotin carboxyl carrier protein subunit [Terriglobales bacterium]
MTYDVTVDGKSYRVELKRGEQGYACRVDGREVELESVSAEREVMWLLIGGRSYEVRREAQANGVMYVVIRGRHYAAEVRDPRAFRGRRRAAGAGAGSVKLVAPMPGKVVRVLKAEGAEVEQGESVVVVEAMKMQNEIRSPKKGVVRKILAAAGAAVYAGEGLAVVE